MYIIIDWACNRIFPDKDFNSFDEAEEFLSIYLNNSYDNDRGEYDIFPALNN